MKLTERQILSPALRTVLYWAVCVVSIFSCEQLHMFNFIGRYSFAATPMYICEAMVFAAPALFLPRHWRVTASLITTASALWLWADIMFVRYNGFCLTMELAFSKTSYNTIVFNCVPGLLRKQDIIYLIAVIMSWTSYIKLKPWNATTPRMRNCVGVTIIAAVVYFVFLICNITTTLIPDQRGIRILGWDNLSLLGEPRLYCYGGIPLYLFYNYQKSKGENKIILTDHQRDEIKNFLESVPKVPEDSAFALNRNKNLIFVIVESLNSSVIGLRHNGRQVTPVLDSLLTAEGTISCLNILPQISTGNSADGQLIYNTGLLPTKNSTAALSFYDSTMKGLPKTLEMKTAEEFIGEDRMIWNHSRTTLQYGYTNLHHKLSEAHTSDSDIFGAAVKGITRMANGKPFMAEVVTLAMHYPFFSGQKKDAAPWLNDYKTDGPELHYIKAVHIFDCCLGDFITSLPEDVRLNSVLIIASDHHITKDGNNIRQIMPIAFIACNTGHTERITRTAGQIDIYPTILQIMGRSGLSPHWLGTSILDPKNKSAVDVSGKLHGRSETTVDSLKAKAWEISELIIRGNYFETRNAR